MGRRRLPLPLLLGIVAVTALALAHRGEIGERAEDALSRGMPAREAELARGFVLGRDEGIDDATVDDFRRSGLSHLLAVSGQNVALLALLAMPLLAALGVPLHMRLVWILAAIAVYVPLAGAGPSIQRAGVMGALGVLATLAGRRASRLYALVLAAGVTLAIDPGIAGDVGWQLSFAAVLGILAMAAPMRGAIAARIGSRGWRLALAEGAAVTIAASVATAPLVAFHFGAVSTTTLAANLLALPAVAPAMWLGMAVAALGQVPGFPVEGLNALAAILLAYIAQVAEWCGRPGWAYPQVRLGLTGLIGCYSTLLAALLGVPSLLRRRRSAMLRAGRRRRPSPAAGLAAAGRTKLGAIAVGLLAMVLTWTASSGGDPSAAPPAGLRVTVLDVGQGDAILLQPADAPAVLVDGGPPSADLRAKLDAAGVDRLGVAVVTHEQSDHVGGIEELLGQMPIARIAYARIGRSLLGRALAAGAAPMRIAEGAGLHSGRLRLEVLWPPRELLVSPPVLADPNGLSLVLLARWGGFSMLLAADAEAGVAPVGSGPVDVLKVAHHGSEDPGLAGLLDRIDPRLATISAGDGNPYGHPAAETLSALGAQGVRVLRTDRDGTIVLDVHGGSVGVFTESDF